MKKFIKYNQKKLEYGLLPTEPIRDIVKILTFGANKYPAHNWLKCKSWRTYYEAAKRHLDLWWGGEDLDPEMKISHLAAVVVNIIFLQQFEKTHKEYDDRLTAKLIQTIKEESNAPKKTRVLRRRQHGRAKRKNRSKRTS